MNASITYLKVEIGIKREVYLYQNPKNFNELGKSTYV